VCKKEWKGVNLTVNRDKDIVEDGVAALVGTTKSLGENTSCWPKAMTAFEETLEMALRDSKKEKR